MPVLMPVLIWLKGLTVFLGISYMGTPRLNVIYELRELIALEGSMIFGALIYFIFCVLNYGN
jgi:energy-converting hydrogenase Eha subunit F